MTNVIEMTGVHKHFGKLAALDGLDLAVAQGEVHGFLGPNGAGKTTTLRVLLGLLRTDGGTSRVLGQDPWTSVSVLHRRLAYVPGDVALWPNLTGGEVIDLLGRLQGGQDAARRRWLLEMFDLDPTKRARTYSKGNRQKVALVAAFASGAELLLLDEPTSGLDPLMEAAFQDTVTEAIEQGATVLLSSHILAEVEALCKKVTIIRAGRSVQSGTLSDLRHLTRTSIVAETASRVVGLDTMEGVNKPEYQDNRVTFDIDTDHLDQAMVALTKAGLTSLQAHPPTLEELFLRQYGDETSAETEVSDGAGSTEGAEARVHA